MKIGQGRLGAVGGGGRKSASPTDFAIAYIGLQLQYRPWTRCQSRRQCRATRHVANVMRLRAVRAAKWCFCLCRWLICC